MPAQQSQHTMPAWRKSEASVGNGNCVEVASCGLSVLVRDSRDRAGAVLAFSSTQWSAFVLRIRDGEQSS